MNGKNRIRIYVCDIPDLSCIDESEVATLPEYRKKRILTAGSERVKASNYAAGIMLRDILGVRNDADISLSGSGKPYLAAGSPFFSVSHDDSHVVLAVGDSEIGVDTETDREIKESVRKRVFNEDELRYCGDDRKKAVLLWTRLEALLKLSGEGIGGIKGRETSLLSDTGETFIRSTEYDGSVISAACGQDFHMTICPFDI